MNRKMVMTVSKNVAKNMRCGRVAVAAAERIRLLDDVKYLASVWDGEESVLDTLGAVMPYIRNAEEECMREIQQFSDNDKENISPEDPEEDNDDFQESQILD